MEGSRIPCFLRTYVSEAHTKTKFGAHKCEAMLTNASKFEQKARQDKNSPQQASMRTDVLFRKRLMAQAKEKLDCENKIMRTSAKMCEHFAHTAGKVKLGQRFHPPPSRITITVSRAPEQAMELGFG